MNKLTKIMAGVVIAVGAGCLAGAAACNNSPDYYTLTFEGKGLDYVFQGALAPEGDLFVSGDEVKSGVEVRFTLSLGADTVGTPQIMLNGSELIPGEDGVYSFIIDRDSKVTVNGLQLKERITFSGGDWHKFYDEDGNLIEDSVAVVKGEEFKFKLWVSPYIKAGYSVTNDTEELTPDSDGFYTVTGGTSTINVKGTTEADADESFLDRQEGDGTEENPYIIRKPIDLYVMAARINDSFYSSFKLAYYKLVEDIDLKGEKLYVIGNNPDSEYVFCGNFDGGGHTISNFYIDDTVINQSTFQREYLQFVGMFGYVNATANGPAVIKNVTLKDYEVEVHPAMQGSGKAMYAGSLIGYGIGVQIEGVKCESGKLVSKGDNDNMAYLGGMAGVLQSAYGDSILGTITFDSYLNGCYSDVEVTGTGAIRSAGGLVGILSTADTNAIAYVSNSVSVGKVNGAMYAGGIVGTLGRYSSVADSYSSSAVAAANSVIDAGVDASNKRACAGGIVGYAENDSVIYGCYSANKSLSAVADAPVADLSKTDPIAAYVDEPYTDASDSALFVWENCRAKTDGDNAQTFTDVLGWSAAEWDLSADVPVYKGATDARKVTLTVKKGDATVYTYDKDITLPLPIYMWYQDGMKEYVGQPNERSWGYYFDKELTKKVPYGYLPMTDCELYVGGADYTQVAGRYYISGGKYGVNACITLDEEGVALFRDGGMNLKCTYSYDGNKITVYNSCLGALVYSTDEISGSYVTVVMEKDGNGGYKLTGMATVATYDEKNNVSYSLEPIELTAQKQAESFVYGEYVNSKKNVLILRENGTGTLTVNNSSRQITFKVLESGEVDAGGIPIVVQNGVVTSFNNSPADLRDSFAGIWKTNANSLNSYEFDGFGTVKNGGITGTYEVEGGQAVLTLGNKTVGAKFSADGALFIDGEEYYPSDGFTGYWYGSLGVAETVELSLGGVGSDGYGEAEMVFYSGVTQTFVGQYSVTDKGVLRVYVGDTLYGEIKINSSTGIADGAFFSFKEYSERGIIMYKDSQFKLYDLFKGIWACNLDGIESVNFSGKGGEDSGSRALLTDANGNVTVAQYNTTGTNTGVLTIKGKKYSMTLDESVHAVTLVSGETQEGGLARRDGWYGVTLYDGDTAYTFDGKGRLSGKVNVSGGETLAYAVSTDGSLTIDGKPVTVTASGFEWNGKTLTFRTGFANTWFKPVTNEEIVISEVSADLTASVTVGGKTVEYKYNPMLNTLTYDEADDKGAVVTTVLSLSGGKELSVVVKGAKKDDYVCITAADYDKWKGEYVADDGSVWAFDGHGLSKYGSGTATYTSAYGKKQTYGYRQNILGMICIIADSNLVFAETKDGGFKKQGAGAQIAYAPIAADGSYLSEARLGSEYLVYDGTGRFWKKTDTGYELKAGASYIHLNRYCSVVEMEAGGGKSIATLENVGDTVEMTLTKYLEWTKSGTSEKYIFDTRDGFWKVEDGKYTQVYTYEYYGLGVYSLTDPEGNKYRMEINDSDTTFKLEEIKDNEE